MSEICFKGSRGHAGPPGPPGAAGPPGTCPANACEELMRDELKLLNAVLESQLENDVSSSSNISPDFSNISIENVKK